MNKPVAPADLATPKVTTGPLAASSKVYSSPAAAPDESFGKAQRRKDMTAIAVAHHVPYVAQAAASHWHDLSLKVEAAAAANGPAFLNVLTDCPVGWGHEPCASRLLLDNAVETCFWPLYEVVDGEYRITYRPERRLPIEMWLAGQKRFAHLLKPDRRGLVTQIQAQVAADWEELLRRAELAVPA